MQQQHIINSEKLSRILSENKVAVFASVALAFLVHYVQAPLRGAESYVIDLWFAVMLIIGIVRLVIGRQFLLNPAKSNQQKVDRLNVLRASIAITGACWGANAYLELSSQSFEALFFCSFIILGVSSAASLSYAIDKFSAMSFLLFAVLPLLAFQLFLNTDVTRVMGVAGVLYLLFMYNKVHKLNQYLLENILMRVEAEQRDMQIKQMAYHDELTGLPNRRLLLDRLNHAVNLCARHQTSCAVMFIDLDHFKKLNDTKGHAMGDLLLQQVANRLTASIRESDTVARFGGDEFVIVLESINGHTQNVRNQIGTVIETILSQFNRPFALGDTPYVVSPSIGIAIMTEHADNSDSLLMHADAAMYQAKQAGRNAARFYS